jgi:hypothetical protein
MDQKPVRIWCDHHLSHVVQPISFAKLIRLLIVACGMLSIPLQWLCEVSGYWWEYAVVHIDPEHPKCETCLVSMQAMEELGNVQLLVIVY